MDNAKLVKNELGQWRWERVKSTRSTTAQLMREQRKDVERCQKRLQVCRRKGWVAGGGAQMVSGGAYSNYR